MPESERVGGLLGAGWVHLLGMFFYLKFGSIALYLHQRTQRTRESQRRLQDY